MSVTKTVALASLTLLASCKVSILDSNKRSWYGSLPLVYKEGSRQKNWKLDGQTGWSMDENGQNLKMDLAFILTTTDDGVDPTETIENDDIVNFSWVIPTN